jgi:hypothetical protein
MGAVEPAEYPSLSGASGKRQHTQIEWPRYFYDTERLVGRLGWIRGFGVYDIPLSGIQRDTENKGTLRTTHRVMRAWVHRCELLQQLQTKTLEKQLIL